MAGLNRLIEGRTTILITHSTALARSADHVAVMAAGRVVEYGVPERLLSSNSAFRRLTGTQERLDTSPARGPGARQQEGGSRMTNGSGRRAVVTGAAGFIGSHLCERLVADGWRVTGIDCFTDYYARDDKLSNLAALATEPAFDLVEQDLVADGWQASFQGARAVFHLAAQAGVRDSFGESFGQYAATTWSPPNACSRRPVRPMRAGRLVLVVVGLRRRGDPPLPGGLDAHAAALAVRRHEARLRGPRARLPHQGLPITGLRYFTVYGPRQRPDMAMRRICDALVSNATFPLFGDGSQSRDFTFVTPSTPPCAAPSPRRDGGLQRRWRRGGDPLARDRHARASRRQAARARPSSDPARGRPPDLRGRLPRPAQPRLVPVVPLEQGLAAQFAWVQDRRSTKAVSA